MVFLIVLIILNNTIHTPPIKYITITQIGIITIHNKNNKVKNIGAEFEIRYNLGTFCKKESKLWDNLTVYSNLSLIKSTVEKFSVKGTAKPPAPSINR